MPTEPSGNELLVMLRDVDETPGEAEWYALLFAKELEEADETT